MNNLESNKKVIEATSAVVGSSQTELIEKLASSFSLEENRRFKIVAERIATKENPSKEEKEEYLNLLKKVLSWDLAYNLKFDGEITGWSLLACGVFPKEFEAYKFLAEDIAIFARAYVNYYMARVK